MLNKLNQRISFLPEMKDVKLDSSKFISNLKLSQWNMYVKPFQSKLKSYFTVLEVYKRLDSDIYDTEFNESLNHEEPVTLTPELRIKNWKSLRDEHLIFLNRILDNNIKFLSNLNNFEDELEILLLKVRMDALKEIIEFFKSL